MTSPSAITPHHRAAAARKVLAASFIGTTFEWYDFFIYASAAALVFAPLFFPNVSEFAGTLAAFSTFAVGFLARPLGGIIIGHYGDRLGRKNMLVLCLLSMGLATVLIGLLPTYQQIGIWAPILLVLLRVIQGFGVGGEWGGAVLMAVEYAPPSRRGLYGGFVQIGVPAGVILSNLAFLAVFAWVPEQHFMSWGWRIPFLLSAVLVIIGLVIRLQIEETPIYAAAQTPSRTPRTPPILEVLRSHLRAVILGALTFSGTSMLGYVLIAYLLSYGVTQLDMPRSTMVLLVLLGSCAWLVTSLMFAAWSDRLGRRRVYIWGGIGALLWAAPFFLLLDTRQPLLMSVAVLALVFPLSAMYSPLAALFSELFPTHLRYTGSSLGYQLGTLIGGAAVPLVATTLYQATGTSLSVAAYIMVSVLIGLIAIRWIPETSTLQLGDIGKT